MSNDARNPRDKDGGFAPSRRSFLTGTVAATAGAASSALLTREAAAQVSSQPGETDLIEIAFRLNGEEVAVGVDPRTTLLDYLRETAGLTGTKVGCRHGQCGACTAHVDGEPYLGCLTLAAQVDGREVTTIERLADVAERGGYASEDGLHPLQAAFVEHDAFQCGYCTPGQIMSGAAAIAAGHASTPEEAREYMSGNLCRCAAYPQITAAVLDARERMEGAGVEIAEGGGARADYHLGLLESATLDEPIVPTDAADAVREG